MSTSQPTDVGESESVKDTRPSTPSMPATPRTADFSDPISPITERAPYALSSSVPGSTSGFSARFSSQPNLRVPGRYFHSRRVKKGTVSKPWLAKKDPREKWVTIIPCVGLLIGVGICAILVWMGLNSVVNHKYCPVLMEDWSNGFDESIWTREAEVGGYGNGQFEYTTKDEENSYVKDGALYIRPTLQDEKLITTNGATIDLRKMGICSSDQWYNCISTTNTTNGTIVNPVKSARLSTKKGAHITYGRVEVTAKLPAGLWLWPAIWMMPVNETYGPWPASGEIDIAESRGNPSNHPQGGNNIISSTLHWGPDPANNGWWRTNVKHKALHTTFADKYHTFGLEWSENYIFTYVNSRLQTVLFTNFNQRLWERGQFPLTNANGTRYIDPWARTGNRNTPFDHPFYLILNLAVGSTNGWFENGKQGKPWVDGSKTERKDFWDKRDEWYPTWKDNSEMIVKSVKMWQQCG
ncbi:Similar to Beta-1,3-glucan-binding protein; acc. no. Q8N0N3 [Pyronema omphalodes CBS 100304]|uniref:Similar to Beta-1,3-glucan-binding protein acc. no. Q8N0N3 n=1 Tax=Pyronema omphalodes (strain CBS 100304) TaxID=1076935 RepID=U4LRR6_PYROM|nr:Similar to Beta-1,3-glucan-binding protein; acc. no. Q8N0N3 [Pyronema omphalodes CBS 100304]